MWHCTLLKDGAIIPQHSTSNDFNRRKTLFHKFVVKFLKPSLEPNLLWVFPVKLGKIFKN